MQELAHIQSWYASQCDGDWEHSYGLRIETLDNPGWHVTIDLHDTELAARSFSPVERRAGEFDWVLCKVEAGQFVGAGGAGNLADLLAVFLSWAEA
ncbi:rhodanese-related sulfurtransferase [Rubrivivax gelatinosus]|uniref:Rhodanese-related sulfurtransferase n=1 Tax=Rubrivivax gelatinosus TaxID=28068 RepID=A0ABS1E031_RUBGE|nr:rhodanese-related sulfurtransferase [Rubrivivax gelatinosus]MBK1715732.1 rhodanese-related sulfurtransferase [Rubrivivax gelatinosus]MBZ8143115.1 rhodanese-related sulfurtransferase [Rubrivivax gelatinosus]